MCECWWMHNELHKCIQDHSLTFPLSLGYYKISQGKSLCSIVLLSELTIEFINGRCEISYVNTYPRNIFKSLSWQYYLLFCNCRCNIIGLLLVVIIVTVELDVNIKVITH